MEVGTSSMRIVRGTLEAGSEGIELQAQLSALLEEEKQSNQLRSLARPPANFSYPYQYSIGVAARCAPSTPSTLLLASFLPLLFSAGPLFAPG